MSGLEGVARQHLADSGFGEDLNAMVTASALHD
jgi:hypothetical protein